MGKGKRNRQMRKSGSNDQMTDLAQVRALLSEFGLAESPRPDVSDILGVDWPIQVWVYVDDRFLVTGRDVLGLSFNRASKQLIGIDADYLQAYPETRRVVASLGGAVSLAPLIDQVLPVFSKETAFISVVSAVSLASLDSLVEKKSGRPIEMGRVLRARVQKFLASEGVGADQSLDILFTGAPLTNSFDMVRLSDSVSIVAASTVDPFLQLGNGRGTLAPWSLPEEHLRSAYLFFRQGMYRATVLFSRLAVEEVCGGTGTHIDRFEKRYLSSDQEWRDRLNRLRELRHQSAHEGHTFITRADADTALNIAAGFLSVFRGELDEFRQISGSTGKDTHQ